MLKKMGVELEKPNDEDVSVEILNSYAGKYNLFPNFDIVVTIEDESLFAQATGQPKFQVYPESASVFYYKVVQAKIEFITEPDARLISWFFIKTARKCQERELSKKITC